MNKPSPDSRCAERRWILDCGSRYWPKERQAIANLPLNSLTPAVEPGPHPEYWHVALPEWAADIGVEGALLVFANMVASGGGPEWLRCDWLSVAYHMLASTSERTHEATKGPALSYSFRLSPKMVPLFERAWVNRIFLFLRRWAAREAGVPEEALFGPLPTAEIKLTHDLDAIRLTPEIRFKQGAFQAVNAGRALAHAKPAAALRFMGDAARYLFSRGDFRTLKRLREMERAAGLKSVLHVYGGRPGIKRGSLRRILMDPAYDVMMIADELRRFRDEGHEVG